MFDYEKIKTSAIAAVAAIILSTTSIVAAVGPARAIETGSVSYVQSVAAVAAAHA